MRTAALAERAEAERHLVAVPVRHERRREDRMLLAALRELELLAEAVHLPDELHAAIAVEHLCHVVEPPDALVGRLLRQFVLLRRFARHERRAAHVVQMLHQRYLHMLQESRAPALRMRTHVRFGTGRALGCCLLDGKFQCTSSSTYSEWAAQVEYSHVKSCIVHSCIAQMLLQLHEYSIGNINIIE